MNDPVSSYAVGDVISHAPYHRLLQFDFVSQDIDAGCVCLGINIRPELMRSDSGDGLHGGAIASLIDVAAFYAVRLAAGRAGATVGLSVDYLRPISGPRAEAQARVVKSGRTQAVVDVEVFDGEALVAVGRARFVLPETA